MCPINPVQTGTVLLQAQDRRRHRASTPELAEHIIKTKSGRFDPKTFDDRYDAALAEVVKAKIEGRKIKPVKPKAEGKVIDLMEALRQSAGKQEKRAKRGAKKPASRKTAATRRKAG